MTSSLLKNSVLAAAVIIANCAVAAEAPQAYSQTVMTLVSSKVEYPTLTKLRHQEGTTVVQIAVGSNGAPSAISVEKSSGFQALDDAAIKAVNAASPFPAPPAADAVVHGTVRFAAQ